MPYHSRALSEPSARNHLFVSWALTAALLLLRGPLVVTVRLLSYPPPAWLDPVYVVGTYALTCVFVWWESESLPAFHLDGMALAIIMLFAPLSTIMRALGGASDMPLALPHFPALLIWCCAILLFISLRRKHVSLGNGNSKSLEWFAIGTLVGLAYALSSHLLASHLYPSSQGVARPGLMGEIAATLSLFPFQIGYAGVSEEPLFRGLLWGRLRSLGWADLAIWIFQGLLFALAHLDYALRDPIAFWFSVSLTGFLTGLLAWRSRTITSSIAAHAALNSLFNVVGIA